MFFYNNISYSLRHNGIIVIIGIKYIGNTRNLSMYILL